MSRYICRACDTEIEPSELHTTPDGELEHENEGEYDGDRWHQLYCGPVEEAGPEDEEETEEDDEDPEGYDEEAEEAEEKR